MLFNPERKHLNRFVFFAVALICCALLVEVWGSYEEDNGSSVCLECHKEAFDEDLAGGLIHEPCLEKRCIVCHCSASVDSIDEDPEKQPESLPTSLSEVDAPEMTVIHVHLHNDASHSFIFSEDKVEDVLLVELWQGRECKGVEKVALRPLELLPKLINDNRPPEISNIRIEKVERGLSSTAVISWQTDKPATSGVRYGLDELDRHSFPHGCLVYDHKLTLASLKTNRKYRFSLVANDFFGNQTDSEPQELSTEKEIMGDSEGGSEALSGSQNYTIVKKELYNANGRYLALFELSQSVSLSIGVVAFQEPEKRLPDAFADPVAELGKGSALADAGDIDEHRYLFSEQETTIDNCFTCHKNIRKEMSHPVNVLPAPGMKVPKEYKLLSNGRMSCMTCHVRHAGENFFRLVRAQGKQFCEACHATY